MLGSVWSKSLRDIRRSFAWWTLGLIGFVALIIAVWPTVKASPSIAKLYENYPEALKAFTSFGGTVDYGTPAGYLGAELFSFMVPLLLLIAAIGAGSRAIAGEEESGTLDLLLSNPISRTRVAVEKLGALGAELVALGAVLLASLAVGAAAESMSISVGHLAAATLDAVLLALTFGAIAFLIGASTGRKGWAIGVTSALAVASYLLNSLAPLVPALKDIQPISPFYHYAVSDPLRSGLDAGHLLILIGILLAAAALAPLLFDRRDLAV